MLARMPADKRRRIVVARMFPENLSRLHELCAYYSRENRKMTSMSEVLNYLVETDYKRRATKIDGKTQKRSAER